MVQGTFSAVKHVIIVDIHVVHRLSKDLAQAFNLNKDEFNQRRPGVLLVFFKSLDRKDLQFA